MRHTALRAGLTSSLNVPAPWAANARGIGSVLPSQGTSKQLIIPRSHPSSPTGVEQGSDMGAADALTPQQGGRGQTVFRVLAPPQAGGASQDRAAGAVSPQLCRGRQASCSRLCHLRGDMASLRPRQTLGTQKSSADHRGLQPFACHHHGKIPQGKQKSMVAFTAAWSTRTCFPPAACEISKKLLQTARRSHGLSHALKAAEALAVPQHLQSTAL